MRPAKPAPSRLGMGLAALLGDAVPVSPDRRTLAASLPVDALRPGPFQPRGPIDPASLEDLVQSVRSQGILQPLLVRPAPSGDGVYQIIAGERRWRAAQEAGLAEVPVHVRALSDTDAMAASLVENLQRQDLDAIEEAEGYRRLLQEFGLTQEQLGTAVGKSRSHVANAMRLLTLPASVRAELQKGALSAGHARALLAHPEPERAAQAVIARGLNVRQTEALASRREAGATPRRPAPARDADLAALEHDLSERLGLRVEITHAGRGGSVRIRYRTLDQLDALIARIGRGT